MLYVVGEVVFACLFFLGRITLSYVMYPPLVVKDNAVYCIPLQRTNAFSLFFRFAEHVCCT